jgi:hypothetical protein
VVRPPSGTPGSSTSSALGRLLARSADLEPMCSIRYEEVIGVHAVDGADVVALRLQLRLRTHLTHSVVHLVRLTCPLTVARSRGLNCTLVKTPVAGFLLYRGVVIAANSGCAAATQGGAAGANTHSSEAAHEVQPAELLPKSSILAFAGSMDRLGSADTEADRTAQEEQRSRRSLVHSDTFASACSGHHACMLPRSLPQDTTQFSRYNM